MEKKYKNKNFYFMAHVVITMQWSFFASFLTFFSLSFCMHAADKIGENIILWHH